MLEQDHVNILVTLSNKVGRLEEGIEELKTHFENHLHTHKFDKILQTVYFALTVIMFCFLRWR